MRWVCGSGERAPLHGREFWTRGEEGARERPCMPAHPPTRSTRRPAACKKHLAFTRPHLVHHIRHRLVVAADQRGIEPDVGWLPAGGDDANRPRLRVDLRERRGCAQAHTAIRVARADVRGMGGVFSSLPRRDPRASQPSKVPPPSPPPSASGPCCHSPRGRAPRVQAHAPRAYHERLALERCHTVQVGVIRHARLREVLVGDDGVQQRLAQCRAALIGDQLVPSPAQRREQVLPGLICAARGGKTKRAGRLLVPGMQGGCHPVPCSRQHPFHQALAPRRTKAHGHLAPEGTNAVPLKLGSLGPLQRVRIRYK